MDKEQYEKIIQKYRKDYPVEIVGLANKLGIEVFETDDWKDKPISGSILRNKSHGLKNGKYTYTCYVNASHSDARKRFTIAHEIAHFILHRDEIGDGIIDDALFRSSLSTIIEVQANQLAADLLMPRALIQQSIDAGNKTIPELAKSLNVSKSAMSIRLGIPCDD